MDKATLTRVRFEYYVLALMVLLLASCTNPLERFFAPEDEGAEGRLTIYTPMDEDLANAYLRLFRGANPRVDVTLVVLSSGETLERLLAERAEPRADVVWGLSATLITILEWQDVLRPYAPEDVERVLPQFRDSSNPPHWVGFGAWMSTFCVNNVRLEELGLPKPDSWESLWNPIYEGQIAFPRPDQSGTGYMIVEAIIEMGGEVQGWENLDALDKNVKVYTTSSDDSCDLAAKGDVAIGVSYDIAPINLASTGQPVEAVFAAEGAGWDIEANALIAKDEIKEAARVFLDWAISEPVMEIYGESRVLLSMPIEVHSPPPGFPEDTMALLYDKDFAWASANRDRIVIEWLARYGAKAVAE